MTTSARPPMPETLSPLERELLGYVETLMNTLQSGTAQFEALEKRSTDMIENRQAALEGSLRSLIASQATLMNAWLASGNPSSDTDLDRAGGSVRPAGASRSNAGDGRANDVTARSPAPGRGRN